MLFTKQKKYTLFTKQKKYISSNNNPSTHTRTFLIVYFRKDFFVKQPI